jgi:hypothetical protein
MHLLCRYILLVKHFFTRWKIIISDMLFEVYVKINLFLFEWNSQPSREPSALSLNSVRLWKASLEPQQDLKKYMRTGTESPEFDVVIPCSRRSSGSGVNGADDMEGGNKPRQVTMCIISILGIFCQ